jgi:hypothetical protein
VNEHHGEYEKNVVRIVGGKLGCVENSVAMPSSDSPLNYVWPCIHKDNDIVSSCDKSYKRGGQLYRRIRLNTVVISTATRMARVLEEASV